MWQNVMAFGHLLNLCVRAYILFHTVFTTHAWADVTSCANGTKSQSHAYTFKHCADAHTLHVQSQPQQAECQEMREAWISNVLNISYSEPDQLQTDLRLNSVNSKSPLQPQNTKDNPRQGHRYAGMMKVWGKRSLKYASQVLNHFP